MEHTTTNCGTCKTLAEAHRRLDAIRPGAERILQDGRTWAMVTSVFNGQVGWRSVNGHGTTPLHIFANATTAA